MTPASLATLHGLAFSATRAWSADEFASLLAQPGMILAGDERAIALLRVTVDEAEVLTLATAPAFRRQGLAKSTLQQAEATAVQQGATHIFLEVAEDNIAATTLYAQAGYRQVGRRPGYYVSNAGHAIAAHVLRKDLDRA